MKQLFITLLVITFGLSVSAQDIKLADFVVANGKAYYTVNLHHGMWKENYLVCKGCDGKKMKFAFDEVEMYRLNGKTYEKKPVIVNDKITDKLVFMEFIKYKNGLKVFSYNHYTASGQLISDVYVFQKDHYVVSINNKNREHLVAFFDNK
jgi:hypothetical protein